MSMKSVAAGRLLAEATASEGPAETASNTAAFDRLLKAVLS
jgi:hypothetical protein